MPRKYRPLFTEQWFKDHTRQKANGVYEIRCSINKVPISGSSKNLDIAVQRFLESLVQTDRNAKKKTPPFSGLLLTNLQKNGLSL